MSGWIKIEKDLESDPRVLRLAKNIEAELIAFRPEDSDSGTYDPCNAYALPAVTLVCGALTRLWIYADSHARKDDTLDLGPDELNKWLGIPMFCELMPPDWLVILDERRVELPGFQEHNGTIARKRALTSKRVAQHRVNTKRGGVTGSNADALPDQDQTKTRPRPRPQEKTELSSPQAGPTERDEVAEVFEHWRTTWNHPRAALDAKRAKLIRERLKHYDAATLCQAITGYTHSPHHCGRNDRNTVYDDLGLLLRDAAHVDAGLRFYQNPPQNLSQTAQHNLDAAREWLATGDQAP